MDNIKLNGYYERAKQASPNMDKLEGEYEDMLEGDCGIVPCRGTSSAPRSASSS